MKCAILHRSKGRLRVHLQGRNGGKMTLAQADVLEYYLRNIESVKDVKVYDRTGDAVILFSGKEAPVLTALSHFSFTDKKAAALVPEQTGRAVSREYEDKIVFTVLKRFFTKTLIPAPIRAVLACIRSIRYIWKGLRCILKGKIEVALLDATAITVSLLRGDFDTAGSVMFLLRIGEILEEWTRKKSLDDLARTMSLNVDKVWQVTGDGQEVLVPIDRISEGDRIIVRTGSMIPLDGKVVSGDASVNQASITGESMPVHKEAGSYAYAGTVVEEGTCVIAVEKSSGTGRYDRIVQMIEASEKMKSAAEDKASHLADKLVPYSLGGTVLAYLLTRNPTRALSVLMVDFSCALKLAIPIATLSAMRESSRRHITVKGGRFLEAVADADTIVFDKTGTLTKATPKVKMVVPFGGRDADEMLRLAACLEEHYPHSIARAVVGCAQEKNLQHEEKHSEVQYVVAHGISSAIDGQKTIIGSYHFVFEDEGVQIPEEERELFDSLPEDCSHLYLAIAGELAAVICIEDPLREEAASVISGLRRLGLSRIVMMTGDSERTARTVAKKVGVDEYYAEVLPEDKASFVRREHEAGRKVIMIGDGINDSPALSEADVGIAISDGAAIAREIADITVSAGDLNSLVTLRELGMNLMSRIHGNYRFIIGFNLGLILLGVAGVLQPTTSALLHNLSTLGISLKSMTDLLPEERAE